VSDLFVTTLRFLIILVADAKPITIPSASSVQPFALDATGDMHVDLMGYTSTPGDKMSIWKNTYDQTNGTQPFTV
jgi:hypothetical protein